MRMLIVVAGGPIATLMTGLLSGLLLCRTGTGTRPGCFFGTLAEISFFLFVLGFFPNSIKARVRNDARLLLLLWSNGIEADEMFLYHIVAQCQCAGLRPRDYPRSLIERLSVASGRPEAIVLYAQLISAWAIDRGDLVTAAAWSQRAEEVSESCDARTRNLARAGVACFGAMFGEDPNISRNKFQGVKLDTLAPEHFRHRAKAAYWLANGNKAEALAEVYRSRLAFPKRLPYYDFEHSLLVHLYRRALSGNVPALTSRT